MERACAAAAAAACLALAEAVVEYSDFNLFVRLISSAVGVFTFGTVLVDADDAADVGALVMDDVLDCPIIVAGVALEFILFTLVFVFTLVFAFTFTFVAGALFLG